ncbi:MAG: CPBP family intramembrane metalloprotease [Prosthecobacter sp.]|uniref:CPBP family intramembrane glutamic endopeptidase n=1 Tax=Prosthecobacter sp. TaxID=1965333 RepID=UPI0019D8068A|nr:CPBP family intramembrane glutamic endopeptidase [Prosthecobacter sp.]MBE2287106.1 CPBP family intramembrane metalloprotease [Prosthecobacter sp.]
METPAVPPPLPEPKPAVTPRRFPRLGSLLAVIAITVCAVFVVWVQTVPKAGDKTEVRPNRIFELMARYAVGVKNLLSQTGQWNEALNDQMTAEARTVARKEADKLRLVILKSWMSGKPPAEEDLTRLAAKNEDLRADVETLRKLESGTAAPDEAGWKRFLKRHGWMARLAQARTLEEKDPVRLQVQQQALGTALTMMGAVSLGMLAAVAGVVLLVLAIVRWRKGQLRFTLARPPRGQGGVLVEAFAIYLTLFLLLPRLLRELPVTFPPWIVYAVASLSLIIGVFWPRLRGMDRVTWRETLGLHRGEGVFREIGAGMLGWITALPLLIVGIMAASWIMKLTGDFPSHPIVEIFAGDAWAKFGAFMLAVVWAPVTEEITFRGLLFPGLSAWIRWFLGIVISAFVFAVIHPQGWAGVPAIMALAAAFSMLRLWRRSLIAPMTAHALNNGIMCVMMLSL